MTPAAVTHETPIIVQRRQLRHSPVITLPIVQLDPLAFLSDATSGADRFSRGFEVFCNRTADGVASTADLHDNTGDFIKHCFLASTYAACIESSGETRH